MSGDRTHRELLRLFTGTLSSRLVKMHSHKLKSLSSLRFLAVALVNAVTLTSIAAHTPGTYHSLAYSGHYP